MSGEISFRETYPGRLNGRLVGRWGENLKFVFANTVPTLRAHGLSAIIGVFSYVRLRDEDGRNPKY